MTEQQLYTLLNGTTALTDSAEIYNGSLPEGAVLPAVTFEYVSDVPYNTLNGDSGSSRARYSISVWAKTYDEAMSLAATVQLTMSGYSRLNRLPLHEPKTHLYRFALDYSIFD